MLNVLIPRGEELVATDIMALHLNDGSNNIVFKPGDMALDKSSRPIPAGTRWVQSFVVTNSLFQQSHSIGIAMYRDSAVLFDVKGWGGRLGWKAIACG